ncbi:MAG: hypothetical protein ACPL07_01245 [Candidatus Bathyarchaeia archaeon]
MVAIDEEVKSVAASYAKLRLKVLDDLRRLDEYSLILFKSFLKYVKENSDKGFSELLEGFLNELELDSATRLSLTRRFYSLAGKRTRSVEQRSILQYV